ncbi:MAG: hypothetical protein EPO58_07270 [Chitinophagaceae bacterium]|nr:MAG: hypothetical protein EPO58_07270 [Chitinophagaceae bacterium]
MEAITQQTSPEFNTVKEEILQHINNPKQLEKLYRKNKTGFQRVFNAVYPDIQTHTSAQVWNERLNFEQGDLFLGPKKEMGFVLLAALVTGLLAKIPDFTGINADHFFMRNISLVGFPMLLAYFLWKQKTNINQLLVPLLAVILSALYINFLPNNPASNSIVLACIHLPVILWTLLGYSFAGGNWKSHTQRIDFLRFNGDFAVMAALLVLAGILFTGITIGLFELIGLHIQEFYAKHIVIWGVSAIPILSTYLVVNNPQLVNKISPLIARIFTPLVFVTLLVFLIAIIYTGKNVYNDRNFLLLFNGLLIAVMAIILFSVTEITKNTAGKLSLFILSGLSLLTIILNGIALSAIAFRLSEFGITPNRIAVLGANLLIFVNLLFVAYQLFRILKAKASVQQLENSIAQFIPVYGIWSVLVTFLFPLLFSFA